jgi:uncharacterized protein YjbI with pentapeptide repeats
MDKAVANELADKIEQILQSESDDFLELAQLAGLNPLKDFKAFDLSDADLGSANLEGVDFSEANLERLDLSSANLEGANFSGANLEGVDFSSANLEGANFSGANLEGVDFSSANLEEANFSGANLEGVDFSSANLEEANFSGANLEGANFSSVHFSSTNLGDVISNSVTQELRAMLLDNVILSGNTFSGAEIANKNSNGNCSTPTS